MKRGLSGTRLVISDAHEGLKAAITRTVAGATWQRCRVHFMRKARRISLQNGLPPEHAHFRADHLAICSCDACGNQRKVEGETLQERRARRCRGADRDFGQRRMSC